MGVNELPGNVQVFHNPFYCGIITSNSLQGQLVDGKHEKLVSKELFLKIRAGLTSDHPMRSNCKDHPDPPLRGLIHCANCNRRYTMKVINTQTIDFEAN